MSLVLPDLLIETTIRDGLAYLKKNNAVIDDIFGDMLKSYASRKYGQAEINKIKALINDKTIAVVHSFHEAEAKSPCFSIQLGSENEAKERAHISDHEYDTFEPITDTQELADLIRVPNFTPTAYDPITGKVSVPDSVDLSPAFHEFIFVDAAQSEFKLRPGISNTQGNKFFFILIGAMPSISGACFIKTFLDYTQHEDKGDSSAVNILIGCHSKEALLTKYLYVILKHIMKSRKRDLIQRGFTNSSFSGSDFTRDLRYEGDMVFTRFFTVTGQVEDSWRSDPVDLIDSVIIDAQAIDSFDNDDIDFDPDDIDADDS